MGIAEGKKTSLWSTHPSLESRIEALGKYTWNS
jgi:Zn-dependent protease with chaperone function